MGSRQGLTTGPLAGAVMAAGFYGLWAFLLFSPYAQQLSSSYRLLYAINPALGALGVFILSRRWVSGLLPSALAGLVYGFGPFGLSFIGFHPLTGLTFAAVPWLMLPSVYWHQGRKPTAERFLIRSAFSGLPFLFIIAFFWAISQHWLVRLSLLPRHIVLTEYDFLGLLVPLSMTEQSVVMGLYHFGLAALLMGLFVYVCAQRVAVLITPAIGLVLAFLSPVFGVSPIIWAAFPMVFLAVLAGVGVQSLLWAGKNDAKWVILCMLAALGLGLVTAGLYLSKKDAAFQYPALFYLASTVALGILLLLSRSGLRWLSVRWMLIASVGLADCYLSGRWLIERLF